MSIATTLVTVSSAVIQLLNILLEELSAILEYLANLQFHNIPFLKNVLQSHIRATMSISNRFDFKQICGIQWSYLPIKNLHKYCQLYISQCHKYCAANTVSMYANAQRKSLFSSKPSLLDFLIFPEEVEWKPDNSCFLNADSNFITSVEGLIDEVEFILARWGSIRGSVISIFPCVFLKNS